MRECIFCIWTCISDRRLSWKYYIDCIWSVDYQEYNAWNGHAYHPQIDSHESNDDIGEIIYLFYFRWWDGASLGEWLSIVFACWGLHEMSFSEEVKRRKESIGNATMIFLMYINRNTLILSKMIYFGDFHSYSKLQSIDEYFVWYHSPNKSNGHYFINKLNNAKSYNCFFVLDLCPFPKGLPITLHILQ